MIEYSIRLHERKEKLEEITCAEVEEEEVEEKVEEDAKKGSHNSLLDTSNRIYRTTPYSIRDE